MGRPLFPSCEWSWEIELNHPVRITHPSGTQFLSPVIFNREDRLEDKFKISSELTEKDSFLISYTIDYLQNKSNENYGDIGKLMVLASNLVIAYRFRKEVDIKVALGAPFEEKKWRKFGEHYLELFGQEVLFFVIGHGEGTLIAISMEDFAQDHFSISKFEPVQLPRAFFHRIF